MWYKYKNAFFIKNDQRIVCIALLQFFSVFISIFNENSNIKPNNCDLRLSLSFLVILLVSLCQRRKNISWNVQIIIEVFIRGREKKSISHKINVKFLNERIIDCELIWNYGKLLDFAICFSFVRLSYLFRFLFLISYVSMTK